MRHCAAGIKIPLDCREGVCATCQGRCESGQYTQDYVDDEALSASDLAERKVLTCQTSVQSDAAFYFDFDSTLCGSRGTRAASRASSARCVQVRRPPRSCMWSRRRMLSAGLSARPVRPAASAGHRSQRSYSFASAAGQQQQLQFLIRLLPRRGDDQLHARSLPGRR